MPLVDQKFNNPLLKVGISAVQAILLDAGLVNWFQADYPYTTRSGSDIVSFNDRKTATAKFIRTADNTGATLMEDLFGSYTGARFNAVESDRSLFNGPTPNLGLPFTWAGVAKLNSNSSSANLMGSFTSSSVRSIINCSAGTSSVRFQYGTASTASLPIVVGTPFAFAAGFDGVNIFLMINGTVSIVAAAGSPSSSAIALGALPGGSQFWDGDVSDIFLCNVALNQPTGAALLAKIKDFTQSAYGLTI